MYGTLTHYRIRCDPYLGIGIFSMIIIPCTCIYCRNSMDLPWGKSLIPRYHPRYSSVTKFKYYPILWKHNDWLTIDFIEKGTDEEEYESVLKLF